MGAFSKFKNLYSLQKKAKGIKRDLKNIHVEAESGGVTIVIDAEMHVISVKVSSEAKQNPATLEEHIEKAMSKALKKAQEIAASKMKDVWGDMGMFGQS